MGNKQSYNVTDANANANSSNDDKVESEVAYTFDSAAKGITMKKSDNDDKYIQQEILYRIDPLPDMPFIPVATTTTEVQEREIN
uniref:Uncharacterized protein n=1 Tax=Panagrolaimus superbus TaxID=310955 RepID=A0A914Z4H2_9BILA